MAMKACAKRWKMNCATEMPQEITGLSGGPGGHYRGKPALGPARCRPLMPVWTPVTKGERIMNLKYQMTMAEARKVREGLHRLFSPRTSMHT